MKHFYFSLGLGWLSAALLSAAAQAQDLTNQGTTITLVDGATLYTSGSLTNSSGTLDLSTGSNLVYVGGNLVNAAGATLTPGTASTVTLNGAAAQQLDLQGAGLYNLTINNTSGGVSLPANSNADVAGVLLLTSGLVTTDASSTLRLLNGATLSGEQSNRYVRGNLAAVKASVPAGTATAFPNSFTLTPATSLNNLTVTRRAGLNMTQVSYGTSGSGAYKGIDRLWQLSAPVNGQVQVSWLPDNDNGLTNFASSQVWARTAAPVAGSNWTRVGPNQDASTTRTVQAPVPAGSSFSFFTVSTSDSPLPVTLVAFTAERQGADAVLRWRTASELNNAYFVVESAVDGTSYQPLGQVAGAGTSSQPHDYQLRDAGLARYGTGLVYYRLRQVDVSGTGSYSPVRTVQVPLLAGWGAQVFPNPSGVATAVAVLLQAEQAGAVQLTLTDAVGRVVARQTAQVAAGTTTLPLESTADLAAGVYALQVRQGSQQQILKLVRQ